MIEAFPKIRVVSNVFQLSENNAKVDEAMSPKAVVGQNIIHYQNF